MCANWVDNGRQKNIERVAQPSAVPIWNIIDSVDGVLRVVVVVSVYLNSESHLFGYDDQTRQQVVATCPRRDETRRQEDEGQEVTEKRHTNNNRSQR